MELRHCEYCFTLPLREVEKHVALCKANKSTHTLTIPELTHVLKNLLQRVDAQDKLIQKLQGSKHTFPPECGKPVLADDDLQLLLRDGIDAVVGKHKWPLHVWQKKAYVFDNDWREATPEDVRGIVNHVITSFEVSLDRLAHRMGWHDDDPLGRFPQTSGIVYGLGADQVRASLFKLCV